MSNDKSSSQQWQTVLAFTIGGLSIVIGGVWLLLLATNGEGTIASVKADRLFGDSWVDPVLVDTDLRSRSAEFSAVTFDESNGRLLIADDEGLIFEFDLGEDGTPITPPRRTLQVNIGAGDIEGLAWMYGSTFVLAHENDGRLTVVTIGEDATTIGADNLERTIDTGIREINGNGIEGVSYVGGTEIEFIVVQERPPTVIMIRDNGDRGQVVPIGLGFPDVSDVFADAQGNYVLLSDEARSAVTVTIDAAGGVTQLSSLDLVLPDGRFEQPEGIVGTADGQRLFVVGESPGPGRFSFGVWVIGAAG